MSISEQAREAARKNAKDFCKENDPQYGLWVALFAALAANAKYLERKGADEAKMGLDLLEMALGIFVRTRQESSDQLLADSKALYEFGMGVVSKEEN